MPIHYFKSLSVLISLFDISAKLQSGFVLIIKFDFAALSNVLLYLISTQPSERFTVDFHRGSVTITHGYTSYTTLCNDVVNHRTQIGVLRFLPTTRTYTEKCKTRASIIFLQLGNLRKFYLHTLQQIQVTYKPEEPG